MEQAHKKRSPLATANSPLILADMGEIYFINLVNLLENTNCLLPKIRKNRL